MKIEVAFILTLCCWINVYSQHPTISKLKSFAAEADMSYYINKAQQNLIDDYNLQRSYFGTADISQLELDLHKEKLVPILTVWFINTENYNYEDNIYDYMVVDTVRDFAFACVDKRMKVNCFANFLDGVYAYFKVKGIRRWRELRNIIRHINARQPELILYCNGIRSLTNFDGFMFIKNNKIYVCRATKNDVFELNDYIHRAFPLDQIRGLNKTFTPLIYRDPNRLF